MRAGVLWAVLAAALAVHVVVLYSPSTPGVPLFPHADKVIHATVFAVPVWAALRLGMRRWVVVAVAAAHAPVSELVQAVVLRDRTGDVLDVLADLAGVVIGVLLAGGRRRAAGEGFTRW